VVLELLKILPFWYKTVSKCTGKYAATWGQCYKNTAVNYRGKLPQYF